MVADGMNGRKYGEERERNGTRDVTREFRDALMSYEVT